MVQSGFNAFSGVDAFWPFPSRAKSVAAPVMPPETAIADQCDPIKAKIQREFSRSFLIRPIMRPYRAWLVDRHHKCLAKVHQQIYGVLQSQGNQ